VLASPDNYAIICGIGKEESMPPKHQDRYTGLTVVATVSGMLRAEVLKSKLEDAGISVLLDYESAGLIFGITADGLQLSEVRLLVADGDADRAQRILDTPPPPGWEEEATESADDS
jgi:hypothetical protein